MSINLVWIFGKFSTSPLCLNSSKFNKQRECRFLVYVNYELTFWICRFNHFRCWSYNFLRLKSETRFQPSIRCVFLILSNIRKIHVFCPVSLNNRKCVHLMSPNIKRCKLYNYLIPCKYRCQLMWIKLGWKLKFIHFIYPTNSSFF